MMWIGFPQEQVPQHLVRLHKARQAKTGNPYPGADEWKDVVYRDDSTVELSLNVIFPAKTRVFSIFDIICSFFALCKKKQVVVQCTPQTTGELNNANSRESLTSTQSPSGGGNASRSETPSSLRAESKSGGGSSYRNLLCSERIEAAASLIKRDMAVSFR